MGSFADQVKKEIRAKRVDADKRTAADGVNIAIRLSGGQNSLSALRKAGHPYARRAPNPSYDPSIINDQGGPFARSWKSTMLWGCPAIMNTDPIAKFLEQRGATQTVYFDDGGAPILPPVWSGNSKMVPRPIDEAIVLLLGDIRRRNLEQAFS